MCYMCYGMKGCPNCDEQMEYKKCELCEGTGSLYFDSLEGRSLVLSQVEGLKKLNLAYLIITEICPDCLGEGVVPVVQDFEDVMVMQYFS